MAIVGFSFRKFDCERNAGSKVGNIEINHNISIEEVSKTSINLGGSNDEVLKIDFVFNVGYSNELGHVKIFGDVIFSDVKAIIDESFKSWSSDKKLPSMVNEEALRFIYTKVSVKAIALSDALNLPSPIPLPKLNFSSEKSKK